LVSERQKEDKNIKTKSKDDKGGSASEYNFDETFNKVVENMKNKS
jgi:hypothetical protein